MKKLLLAMAFVLLLLATAVNTVPGKPSGNALSFKTKTVAFCEAREDSVYCHDEVVVNCGDDEYVLPKTTQTAECGTLSVDIPAITAFAVFDKDWKDPREPAE